MNPRPRCRSMKAQKHLVVHVDTTELLALIQAGVLDRMAIPLRLTFEQEWFLDYVLTTNLAIAMDQDEEAEP